MIVFLYYNMLLKTVLNKKNWDYTAYETLLRYIRANNIVKGGGSITTAERATWRF